MTVCSYLKLYNVTTKLLLVPFKTKPSYYRYIVIKMNESNIRLYIPTFFDSWSPFSYGHNLREQLKYYCT